MADLLSQVSRVFGICRKHIRNRPLMADNFTFKGHDDDEAETQLCGTFHLREHRTYNPQSLVEFLSQCVNMLRWSLLQ